MTEGRIREIDRWLAAVQYFTRIPVPARVGHGTAGLADAIRYFPAVGALVGAIGAAAYLAAHALWPPAIAALLALAATVAVTGAFHEDGLADAVDGLVGGLDRERALAIMKDPAIGSFGATALVLALALRGAGLVALSAQAVPYALIGAHTVSRFAASAILCWLPYARGAAGSRSVPLVTGVSFVSIATGAVTAALAAAPLGAAGIAAASAALLVAALWAWYLKRRIGGFTGDCLGAAQQFAEVAFYLGLLAKV
jgi:adenosylcobinamide-GDP ribazoletransferase